LIYRQSDDFKKTYHGQLADFRALHEKQLADNQVLVNALVEETRAKTDLVIADVHSQIAVERAGLAGAAAGEKDAFVARIERLERLEGNLATYGSAGKFPGSPSTLTDTLLQPLSYLRGKPMSDASGRVFIPPSQTCGHCSQIFEVESVVTGLAPSKGQMVVCPYCGIRQTYRGT